MDKGPNFKKIVSMKMAMNAIPKGGNFMDGVRFLVDKDMLISGFKKAWDWAEQSIIKVREATEPNIFKNATDEEISAEILKKIEEKKKKG